MMKSSISRSRYTLSSQSAKVTSRSSQIQSNQYQEQPSLLFGKRSLVQLRHSFLSSTTRAFISTSTLQATSLEGQHLQSLLQSIPTGDSGELVVENDRLVSIACPVAIPPKAQYIIDMFLKVVEQKTPTTELRIAGGWVRDLLRTHSMYRYQNSSTNSSTNIENDIIYSHPASNRVNFSPEELKIEGLIASPSYLESVDELGDIDIAISNMTGCEFSVLVNEYCAENNIECKLIDVRTQVLNSRHLETSRGQIAGVSVDLVNLRTESYANNEDHRIPTMEFGSPGQDAMRRDFTVNALFYNLHTKQIEDFNGGIGLSDLKSGILRTPLPALTIFIDDPLRVLRVLRFASRFSFIPTRAIITAANADDVHEALIRKVSRERIGQELHKAFMSPTCNLSYCLNLLSALRSVDVIMPRGMLLLSWYTHIAKRIKARSGKHVGAKLTDFIDKSRIHRDDKEAILKDFYMSKNADSADSVVAEPSSCAQALKVWETIPPPHLFSGGLWGSTFDSSITLANILMNAVNLLNRINHTSDGSLMETDPDTSLLSFKLSPAHRTALGFALTLIPLLDNNNVPNVPMFSLVNADVPFTLPTSSEDVERILSSYSAMSNLPSFPTPSPSHTHTNTSHVYVPLKRHPLAVTVRDELAPHVYRLGLPVMMQSESKFILFKASDACIVSTDLYKHKTKTETDVSAASKCSDVDYTDSHSVYSHLYKHVLEHPPHVLDAVQKIKDALPRFVGYSASSLSSDLYSGAGIWWRPISPLSCSSKKIITTNNMHERLMIVTPEPQDSVEAVQSEEAVSSMISDVLLTCSGHNKNIYSLNREKASTRLEFYPPNLPALLTQAPVQPLSPVISQLYSLFPSVLTIYNPTDCTYIEDVKHMLVFSLRLHTSAASDTAFLLLHSKWLVQVVMKWYKYERHLARKQIYAVLQIENTLEDMVPSLWHQALDEIDRLRSAHEQVLTDDSGKDLDTKTKDFANLVWDNVKTRPISPSLLVASAWSANVESILEPVLSLTSALLYQELNDEISKTNQELNENRPLYTLEQVVNDIIVPFTETLYYTNLNKISTTKKQIQGTQVTNTLLPLLAKAGLVDETGAIDSSSAMVLSGIIDHLAILLSTVPEMKQGQEVQILSQWIHNLMDNQDSKK